MTSTAKRNKFQVQHFKPFSALCTSVSSYSSTLKILMTAITPPMVFQYIADNKIKGREGSKGSGQKKKLGKSGQADHLG